MDDLEELFGEVNFYQPETKPSNALARVIYLVDQLDIKLPDWILRKLPLAENISQSKSLYSPLLTKLYQQGKSYGEGTVKELQECLDNVLHAEMKTFDERRKFTRYIESLASGLFKTNVEKRIQEVEGKDIVKFNSGFEAFDRVIGGFYQGAFCIAGLPGSGKTSLLLALAAAFGKTYPVWYFQTEIPAGLIESRIELLSPKTWKEDSYLHVGNYSSASILEKVKANPDPNRIIVYDSPEIKDVSIDTLDYFTATYQDLVQLKLLSKCVFVTSQVKQNISWNDLGIYSLNDSASKARYLDGIIYLSQFADTTLIKSAKNRFGPLGNGMVKFNLETMQVEQDDLSELFS